ncbi:hypothetical protein FNV43_RR04986 [Rhamnella rubrinervis]|uniref:very-long-chain 3-oxoacyl-CoA synthase n=1 Tax=Rhamnella rubrinervis TaxID=2594499 RepID=A0A8K0MQT3_9ROSA|nr:hypothetical protein FNV43_RR04986 [Rhamnella rubrinervis]
MKNLRHTFNIRKEGTYLASNLFYQINNDGQRTTSSTYELEKRTFRILAINMLLSSSTMAAATASPVLTLLSLILSSSLFHPCKAFHEPLKACNFNAIYQLGDSLADTGNLILENPASPIGRLPYGETFFKKPTGRSSDGLLMIDYIAISAGIPLLDPYLNKNALFSKGRGVNFAVAGSTALPVAVLAQLNISSPFTNSSLSIQLDWMDSHFNSICFNAKDCAKRLERSLFMVGEIGGNDYDLAIFVGNKTIKEAIDMVPQVVQTIKDAVKKVIGYGALTVVVPGNFQIGCLPYYLTAFKTNDSSAYDEHHCLKGFNEISVYHNDHLRKAIEELREEHSDVTIIYGDYYNAFQWVLSHTSKLGFDAESLQKSCCGIGGDYNFDLAKPCGTSGVPACSNPDKRISWDGVHLTQKANQYMSYWLIQKDLLRQLRCATGLIIATALYFFCREKPVYLIVFMCYRPPDTNRIPICTFIEHTERLDKFDRESIEFQTRVIERSGIENETYLPTGFRLFPNDQTLKSVMEEVEMVLFSVIQDLFHKHTIDPETIDILITNCSLVCPTTSLASMIINKFGLKQRHELQSLWHGMQLWNPICFFGSRPPSSPQKFHGFDTQHGSNGWWCGVAPKPEKRQRAKYKLKHLVRTHVEANDGFYKCVVQEPDDEGFTGISLSRSIKQVDGEALKINMRTLAVLVLPYSEHIKFVFSLLWNKIYSPARERETYIPDFKKAFEHFCIHAGEKSVIEMIKEKLKLKDIDVEASKVTLYRFGNTSSSSSTWYSLSYLEAKGRVKRGDRIWQLDFGCGFKCASAFWKCINKISPGDLNAWLIGSISTQWRCLM